MSPPLTSSLPVVGGFNTRARRGGYRNSGSAFLNKLPLEVRNSIYQLCIEDSKVSGPMEGCIYSPRSFGLSIVPRLYDPPVIFLEGYGSIPLREVNRQVYQELAHQLTWNVDRVRIGSYNFEHKEPDPHIHWNTAYSMLQNHPGLSRSVKHVILRMPCLRDEMMRNGQLSLSYANSKLIRQFDESLITITPGLVQCLETFRNLEAVSIIFTVEKREPPNFDFLLPLSKVCELAISVSMVPPQAGLNSFKPWISRWEIAWANFLRNQKNYETNLQAALLKDARGAAISRIYHR